MSESPRSEGRRIGKAGLQFGSIGVVGCATFSIVNGVVALLLYLLIDALA